jgi:hypothetical protein
MDLTVKKIKRNCGVLLDDLRHRQGVLRDYVRGVARQYATGLYLYGRPGTAKTHTVRAVLDDEICDPLHPPEWALDSDGAVRADRRAPR